jgi:hypothetical protein
MSGLARRIVVVDIAAPLGRLHELRRCSRRDRRRGRPLGSTARRRRRRARGRGAVDCGRRQVSLRWRGRRGRGRRRFGRGWSARRCGLNRGRWLGRVAPRGASLLCGAPPAGTFTVWFASLAGADPGGCAARCRDRRRGRVYGAAGRRTRRDGPLGGGLVVRAQRGREQGRRSAGDHDRQREPTNDALPRQPHEPGAHRCGRPRCGRWGHHVDARSGRDGRRAEATAGRAGPSRDVEDVVARYARTVRGKRHLPRDGASPKSDPPPRGEPRGGRASDVSGTHYRRTARRPRGTKVTAVRDAVARPAAVSVERGCLVAGGGCRRLSSARARRTAGMPTTARNTPISTVGQLDARGEHTTPAASPSSPRRAGGSGSFGVLGVPAALAWARPLFARRIGAVAARWRLAGLVRVPIFGWAACVPVYGVADDGSPRVP